MTLWSKIQAWIFIFVALLIAAIAILSGPLTKAKAKDTGGGPPPGVTVVIPRDQLTPTPPTGRAPEAQKYSL